MMSVAKMISVSEEPSEFDGDFKTHLWLCIVSLSAFADSVKCEICTIITFLTIAIMYTSPLVKN